MANSTDLDGRGTWRLVGGQQIRNVHSRFHCRGGTCSIHSPSNHHMRDWTMNFRGDRGIMERICQHGIGHPDPDDPSRDMVHGCDGCCNPDNKYEGLD